MMSKDEEIKCLEDKVKRLEERLGDLERGLEQLKLDQNHLEFSSFEGL